jgi:uncharacterized membrane protein YjfL (UPF0719 family)
MNEQIAILGLIEVLSAISCGVFILWLTFRMARVYGKKRLGVTKSNISFNILVAGILFSVGYIMAGVIQPILESFRLLSASDIETGSLVWKFLSTGGMYIAISYVSAVLITLVGMRLYTVMTSMDEAEEIKENNVGVAIIMSVILIVMSLMTRDGVVLIIESLIPYPELPPL